MNCDDVFQVLTRAPFPTGTAVDAQVEAHLRRCGSCRRLATALEPALEMPEEAIGPEESRDLPTYWGALYCGAPSEEPTSATRDAGPQSPASTRVERVVAALARMPGPQAAPSAHRWQALARFSAAVLCGLAVAGAWQSWHGADWDNPLSAASTRQARWQKGTAAAPPLVSRPNESTWGALGLQSSCLMAVPASASERAIVSENDVGAKTGGGVRPLITAVGTRSPADEATWVVAGMGGGGRVACCTRCHRSGGEARSLEGTGRAQVLSSCVLCHEGSASNGAASGR